MGFNFRRVNVIGAGRLGKVMAYLFSKYLGMEIIGICNQHLDSAERAAIEIGQGHAVSSIAQLEPADIYFIAVPDDKIAQIAFELKANQLQKNVVVMHFSANLSTEVINFLDCQLVSVHPLQSFCDFQLSIANFKGTYCAIETPNEVLYQDLKAMFERLGGKAFPIKAKSKVLYHTAAVVAANYLVTLAHSAKVCLLEAGIENDNALEMIISLMQSVLNNLHIKKDCKSALTGPISRSDTTTLISHLDALDELPQIKQLYQVLGIMSLNIVNHNSDDIKILKNIFEN